MITLDGENDLILFAFSRHPFTGFSTKRPLHRSGRKSVEDCDTLEANALKKAREVRDFTGLSALADDTGLFVDALDGAPGVHAARFASGADQANAGYIENYQKLLDAMKDVSDAHRAANFQTVMAVALIFTLGLLNLLHIAML